ncbi:covalently-linked cell wall [Fusarium albosuccineum]|uniref:Covalently-linked cell wall n=1 Tax=Fusarium albosuccineum TaxID=1237068 RepID=A0A8H4LEH3_9HYPO|nr:covalently-linked cell wall [Fusarium albosuccineum]
MRSSLTLLALAATALAHPQAVTEDIKPDDGPPKGCTGSYGGRFEVTIFKSENKKRDMLQKRSCNGEGVLVMTLEDGVLKDAQGRTGYISDSYQFQFDEPPQSGSIYTAGFSICSNGTLALGPSAIFWQCQSGDFYNLYDRHWAEQCEPVEVGVMPCGDSSGAVKRKVVGSSIVATTVVTVVADGVTKEVPTTIAVPMCQIGDGQVQVRTTPCDDMDLPIITAPPVSQVSDGKLAVPTTAPPAPPVQPQDVPAGPGEAPGGSDTSGDESAGDGTGDDAAGDEPAGDEPAGDESSGETPADESKGAGAPTGASAGDEGSDGDASGSSPASNTDSPAEEGGSTETSQAGEISPTGIIAPTGTADSDSDDVLATDSAAPSGTDEAEETDEEEEVSATGSGPTRAVKPFRSSSSDSDDAEETDSSSDATSTDEGADAASDAIQVLPGISLLLALCVAGGLMIM